MRTDVTADNGSTDELMLGSACDIIHTGGVGTGVEAQGQEPSPGRVTVTAVCPAVSSARLYHRPPGLGSHSSTWQL